MKSNRYSLFAVLLSASASEALLLSLAADTINRWLNLTMTSIQPLYMLLLVLICTLVGFHLLKENHSEKELAAAMVGVLAAVLAFSILTIRRFDLPDLAFVFLFYLTAGILSVANCMRQDNFIYTIPDLYKRLGGIGAVALISALRRDGNELFILQTAIAYTGMALFTIRTVKKCKHPGHGGADASLPADLLLAGFITALALAFTIPQVMAGMAFLLSQVYQGIAWVLYQVLRGVSYLIIPAAVGILKKLNLQGAVSKMRIRPGTDANTEEEGMEGYDVDLARFPFVEGLIKTVFVLLAAYLFLRFSLRLLQYVKGVRERQGEEGFFETRESVFDIKSNLLKGMENIKAVVLDTLRALVPSGKLSPKESIRHEFACLVLYMQEKALLEGHGVTTRTVCGKLNEQLPSLHEVVGEVVGLYEEVRYGTFSPDLATATAFHDKVSLLQDSLRTSLQTDT